MVACKIQQCGDKWTLQIIVFFLFMQALYLLCVWCPAPTYRPCSSIPSRLHYATTVIVCGEMGCLTTNPQTAVSLKYRRW